MNERTQAAIAAMAALIQFPNHEYSAASRDAVRYADALLAALSPESGQEEADVTIYKLNGEIGHLKADIDELRRQHDQTRQERDRYVKQVQKLKEGARLPLTVLEAIRAAFEEAGLDKKWKRTFAMIIAALTKEPERGN